jgi:hypothetical protein
MTINGYMYIHGMFGLEFFIIKTNLEANFLARLSKSV